MKLPVCIALLSSFSAPVLAQSYILRIEGGPDSIDLSSGSASFSIDVIGDAEEGLGSHMLWGSFGVIATGNATIESMTWQSAPWSEFTHNGGYAGEGLYNSIEFGQFARLSSQLRDGSELGQRIGTFEITLNQGASLDGSFSFELFVDPFQIGLSTIEASTNASYYSTPETLVLEGFTTNIVPAPGSSVLIVGAGSLGFRRRRSGDHL